LTYWVTASNAATVNDSYFWAANNPNITPAGIATSAGYRFNNGPPPPSTASNSFNSYAVLATVGVPEPSTWALTSLAVGFFSWAARRRGPGAPSQAGCGVPL
jgi:hypothetical protein